MARCVGRATPVQFSAPALFLGWGVFVLLLASPNVLAQEPNETVKVRVQGFGEGEGRAARAAALSAAEEEAVGLIISETVPDKWWPMLDAIRAQLHSYVRTSRPITIQDFANGVEVDAEVYVYESQLRRDIAALLFKHFPRSPRVALIVAEESANVYDWAVAKNGFCEQTLRKRFDDAGFTVMSSESITSAYPDADLMDVQAGGTSSVSMFGRDIGADLVVRADSIVRLNTEESNLGRYYAVSEIDLIRPTDALNVYRAESEAIVESQDPEMGGRQAAQDAVDRVIRELLVESVLAFANVPSGQHYTVTVELPATGPWLSRLRRGMRDRLANADIFDMRHTPDRARFSVEFDGGLGDLVHALVDEPFENFALETEHAVGFELELTLYPSP